MGTVFTTPDQVVLEHIDEYHKKDTSNIQGLYVVKALGRHFIFIGEAHKYEETLDDISLIRFMREICGTVPIDFFIEEFIDERWGLRYRTVRQSEISRIMSKEHDDEMDSLNLIRSQSKAACDTHRIHAVDVRDRGFACYLFDVHEDLDDFSERFDQRVTQCFSYTLQNNLDCVVKLANKSKNVALKGAADAVARFTALVAERVRGVKHAWDIMVLSYAYAMLVDVYTFARMCRADNSNVCIFYGGQYHAQHLRDVALRLLPNATLQSDYTSPTATESEIYTEGGMGRGRGQGRGRIWDPEVPVALSEEEE